MSVLTGTAAYPITSATARQTPDGWKISRLVLDDAIQFLRVDYDIDLI